MDDITRRMGAVKWKFADKDPAALAELEQRIAAAARDRKTDGTLTYTDLARGIAFQIPTINKGAPYTIDIHDWKSLDRLLIGEFLGYISMRSYTRHGFMASALAVGADSSQPSEHFFRWMRELGALTDNDIATALVFWQEQVDKARAFFRKNTTL